MFTVSEIVFMCLLSIPVALAIFITIDCHLENKRRKKLYEKVAEETMRIILQNETKDNSFRRLNSNDYDDLTNRFIFMNIDNFYNIVKFNEITSIDGFGYYIYTDKECNLYINEKEKIDFFDFRYNDINKLIELKSYDEYTLIGVFWYNR